MSDIRVLTLIIVMALVTMMIRFLPFFIFKGNSTPKFISYLGKYLPYSIMAMLVVYCVKDVSVTNKPYGIPELIAIGVVAILHIVKRNTLLSIVCGTVCYMLLKQLVFI
ncbi:MAG: AzlD domain-containing protein [Lachnospiraceae bacterium]|nr:AzlD domain-containing protein [Lachnospiraceae bacterium]